MAFVRHGDNLYELDGRRDAPISHGNTSPQTLLQDAFKVIQSEFMARDPAELRFTVLALTPAVED